MQIESLKIEKKSSYDKLRPGEMVGTVTISGAEGKQEVILQTQTLVQAFNTIRQDLISASKKNAEMTRLAIDEAINGPLLVTATTVAEIPF